MSYKFNPFTGTLDDVGPNNGNGVPGGSDTQVQFNDNGVFGGDSDFTWDDTSTPKVLGIGGDINLDDGGTFTTTLQTITPTAARTISFPDATGTVALVGGSSGNLIANQSGAYAGIANSSVDSATGNITLGSRFISTVASAVSASPVLISGTWLTTGGANNTTFPTLYITPAGTAAGTSWSTAGTGLGLNAPSAFSGNFLHLLVNGTTEYTISPTAFTFAAGNDIALATTTGTKIGTGTTQLLSFWNATPIVQPANTVAIDTLLVNTGLRASGGTAVFATDITRVGANGQETACRQLTELTTIAAAADTDTTIQIPAKAIVLGVTVRVTTVIPTAATFDVGIAGTLTKFGTGISTAATTTNVGSITPELNASAISIRITPNLTPANNTGRVRVTIHYMQLTAATS